MESLSRRSFIVVTAATLLVWTSGCDQITSEFFDPDAEVPNEQIIDLRRARAPGPLPANGAATDTLIARIPERATTRVVTFTTTGGMFELSNSKELKVRAESPGPDADHLEARAVLRTDTIAARVFVRASIADYSDTVEVAFVQP